MLLRIWYVVCEQYFRTPHVVIAELRSRNDTLSEQRRRGRREKCEDFDNCQKLNV